MIDFIDILGDRHGAVTEYSIRHGVNGEKSISGTVYTNDEVIHGVDRGWRLEIDNEFYVITFAVPVDSGNETQLEFDAVHEFFYEFSKKNVYSTLNGSNTAVRYLDFIFNGSGYQYNLEVTIPAFEKEEFGMTNRLALFNDFIKSTGVEFVVNNRVVRILREVGTDLSTIVKKGFNMQELRLEKNLKDFVTYKRGFGAWNNDEDQSQGRLEAVYRSPLADLYGELEDEPLVDERFSVKANLEERLQSDVENSYSISVQLTMEDLTKAGYEYEQPRTGDYIMAMNEDLGFEQKIRIVNYESHYDVNGQLIDHDITCNSLGIAQKNIGSAGLRNTINQALDNANLALERANYAVVSADGKTTNYFGEDDPITLGYDVRYKDTWYQVIGEDKVMNVWNGAEWEPITDTRVSKRNAELIAEQQATLEEVKTTADYSYDQLQQTIANSGFTDLYTAFGNVKTLSEQAESNAYNAMQKAIDNASLIGGLDDSISSMSVAIDDINNSLTLKANTTDIDRIDGTITDINNELTFQSGVLSSKVSQTVYNEAIGNIETTQTQLIQTFEDFETSVTGSDGRLTLAEQFLDGFRNTAFDPSTGQLSLTEQTIAGLQDTVSDPVNGLETRVTTIANGFQVLSSDVDGLEAQLSVTNENVLARVQKGDVISQINLEAESTLIQTGKLLLDTETVVFGGDAFIPGAYIEDASIDSAKISQIDASQVDVINLNADSISGNEASFIAAMFSGDVSQLTISSDSVGMMRLSDSSGYAFEITNNEARFDLPMNMYAPLSMRTRPLYFGNDRNDQYIQSEGNTLQFRSGLSDNNVQMSIAPGTVNVYATTQMHGNLAMNLNQIFYSSVAAIRSQGNTLQFRINATTLMSVGDNEMSMWRTLNMNGHTIINSPSISDERLKEFDWDAEEDSLAIVKSWRLGRYRFNEKAKDALGLMGQNEFGLSSQNTPDLMTYTAETDIYGVNHLKWTARNSHAIQQLALGHENVVLLASKADLKAGSNEERIEVLEAELKLLKGERE